MKRTKNKKQELIILANDPSLTAWGWVVLDLNDNIYDVGCIKTKPEHTKRRIRKGDDFIRRMHDIDQVLLDLVDKYKVTYLLSELPHGSQSAVAAVMIGAVAAAMQMLADSRNIGIEWYSEGDAKKAVLGKISCTKQEMIDAVADLYDVPWTGIKYKDEAMADAMAIYHAAVKTSSTFHLFKTL